MIDGDYGPTYLEFTTSSGIPASNLAEEGGKGEKGKRRDIAPRLSADSADLSHAMRTFRVLRANAMHRRRSAPRVFTGGEMTVARISGRFTPAPVSPRVNTPGARPRTCIGFARSVQRWRLLTHSL